MSKTLEELEKELDELYEERTALVKRIEKKERECKNIVQLQGLNKAVSGNYECFGDIIIDIYGNSSVVVEKGTLLHSKLINCIKNQIQIAIEMEEK